MKRHCHFGHLPPAKRTRALPYSRTVTRPTVPQVISPHDRLTAIHHACPTFIAVFPEQSTLLPSVTTHEPWYPTSEAIKQSADWDHPTNPPYLFNKLWPGPRPGFTKSDSEVPSPWAPKDVKLLVTISPRQATDLFFFPLMIGPEITCTCPWPFTWCWRSVLPLLYLLAPQASSELLMVQLLSPVSRWSNHLRMLQAIAHGPPDCTALLLPASSQGCPRALFFAGFVGEFLR